MSHVSELFDLTGRVAIVTGGMGRLGTEFATALAQAGAEVALFDIRVDQVSAGPAPPAAAGSVVPVAVDVTDKVSIAAGLEATVKRFGPPSILVNNAGLDVPPSSSVTVECGPFESYPESSWDKTMAVNLKAVFLCSQVIGGFFAENGGGSIINISSIYGNVSPDQRVYEGMGEADVFIKPITYAASKSGVLNMTRYLATYWAKAGVRVNTLSPGGVFDNQAASFVKKYSERTPLGRMARVDEYNGAIVFLASEASSYMTGANLIIDGGWTAW